MFNTNRLFGYVAASLANLNDIVAAKCVNLVTLKKATSALYSSLGTKQLMRLVTTHIKRFRAMYLTLLRTAIRCP